MMSVKTLERSSRCTKDPNPLATAMHVMGTKYPLSIDKEAIKKFQIQKSFYPLTNEQQQDYHRYGRVLAKKELIDWWIEKAPTDEELKVIGILTSQAKRSSYDAA